MSADITVKTERDDEEKSVEDTAEYKVSTWGVRHQQSVILFFMLTIAYSMRSCMGVALVAMTHQEFHTSNEVNITGHSSGNANDTLSYTNDTATDTFEMQGVLNALMLAPPYPIFKWSKKVQDTVISSFFWGYMTLQIPAGQLAHRFGARYLVTGSMLINCVIMAIAPLGAYYGGWITLIILRIFQGLTQACIVPGIHTFFGKWAPLEERGRLTSFTYSGQAFGTVLGLPITGYISSTAMGWPGLFRIYAIMSGAIGIVFWWLAADTPSKHPKISIAEKKYIEDGLGHKAGYEKRHLPVPWSKILKNMGVYAIIASHCGNTWGQLILYSEVPSYMDKVMGVNMKANGLLTALPFMVMFFTNFFFSWLTDMLIVKKVMSVTNVRKFANSLGYIPAAVGLVVLAYAPKNIYVVEALLITICAFKISSHLGFQVNHIDISPNFAGTLMSLSNFVSNGISSLAPIVSGIILTDVKNVYLWRQVFFVTAGMYTFTNLFYCIFGTGETAEWNDPDSGNTYEETKQEENELVLEEKLDRVIVT